MNHDLELEVFRSGDYGPRGRWSDDALDQLAEDYAAERHEAPVTLDHAQTGPALGWVAGVRRSGDRLLVRLKDLNDGLIELLRDGAFKKRSVEIYNRLPETGRPYLKAVSFLGAGAPAVKGLRDVLFTDEGRTTEFRGECGEFCEIEFMEPHKEPRIEPRDESLRSDQGESDSALETSPAEAPAVFTQKVIEKFNELEAELRRAGRWIPSWEHQGVREFFVALSALDEIEAAPDQHVQPADWFARFLTSLPAYLPMGEAAPSTARHFHDSIPNGDRVSSSSIELPNRALALRDRQADLTYAQALRECAKSF